MKGLKLFALTFATLLITTCAMAQNRQEKLTPEESAKRQTEMLTKSVDLSEDQSKKVYDIYLKYAEKGEEIRKEKSDDMRKEMLENNEKRDSEINNLLSDEQKKKFEKLKEENKSRGKQQRRR